MEEVQGATNLSCRLSDETSLVYIITITLSGQKTVRQYYKRHHKLLTS